MRDSLEIKEKIFNKQSIVYHHQIEIKPRVSEIERRTVAAGRFILATNIESSSEIQIVLHNEVRNVGFRN